MLQKVRSATKSSRSDTNSETPSDIKVQFVKGVGPRLGSVFASRGIQSVKDLLTFFPRAYEDRSKFSKVDDLVEGELATVSVKINSVRQIPLRGRPGKGMLEVRTADTSGVLVLRWFHSPRGMQARFVVGSQILVTGKPKFFMGQPQIVHPEVTFNQGVDAETLGQGQEYNVGRVVPVYTEIEGVSTRLLRRVLWEALEKYTQTLTEDLPNSYLQAHQLPPLKDAVKMIHFPPESIKEIQDLVDFNTPAHWRMIYEEFFKFEYLVLRRRLRMEQALAPSFGNSLGKDAVSDLEKVLPFKLTGDQHKVIQEILADLSQSHPMNRLVQGDVGSGKTAVAFLTAGCVLAEGGQAALMAPTEILAEQHYLNSVKLFGGRLNTALLTGKTPQSERTPMLARLAAGEPMLLIGTHALIEDPVIFKNLSYILIDEQHRFGVEQRRTLRRKGVRLDPATGRNLNPHQLTLTATPIPRTLALTAYGDLSVSSIKELPPGRSPILTKVVRSKDKGRAYASIREELKKGHQAYIIYPLVNDSEAEGFTSLKSAVSEADRLAKEVFPEFVVGLLHGQQRPDEKAEVMQKFKRGDYHVLVSTTVVEVGVDVPNATVMAIEHAERFGLSQLHQLRGRVGRGSRQSYCFLFTHPKTGETTTHRLEVLEDTTDGFKIAEADLEIRGPGEFLGVRQSGSLPFRMANLVRDQDWLLKARNDAIELLKRDPELTLMEHLPLRRYFEREGKLQSDRLQTS